MKNSFNKIILFASRHITLAKLLGGFSTALMVASFKYYISGGFHIEYCEFGHNLGIALLAWTLNVGIIGWLTDYLCIKGININIYQFMYGFDKMNVGQGSLAENVKFKLYNAMESDEEPNFDKKLDKGKGVDREVYPYYDREVAIRANNSINETKPLEKGKGKVDILLDSPTPVEPHMATWNRYFPGVDPAAPIPKRTNPGPGFNVPGGEVPLHDPICKHLDWNSHFLRQFRTMDLEIAVQQRDNYFIYVRVIESKLNFANNALSNVPTVPTTEYEFKLKNQILRDLDSLNKEKARAEARATLLNSRIQFIEDQINKV
jgi:hypothetical protein